MNYIFYSVIGPHGKETPREIINRKRKEIDECKKHFSLWSAKIDIKSKEEVWKLSEDSEVVVLCKINPKAADPVASDQIECAKCMIGPKGEEIIPEGIKSTYMKNKNYQAYVVKEYEILESPIKFDFSKYESILSNGTRKSFKDRFRNTRFQNTFGCKNDNLTEPCKKDIMVKMKLQYPFVVDIK